MKQSEIRIGEIYVEGRGGGSQGVYSSGTRIRILEKNVSRSQYHSRADGVRVCTVNEDGSDRIWEHSERNDRMERSGKRIERIIAARYVLSLKDVEEQEERSRQAAEERARRQAMIEQTKAEVEDKIGTFFGISPVDITVRVQWDAELDAPVPQDVRMNDMFAFMDALSQAISERNSK
jgi:hypothetical protein